jgi:hypothetical protein
MNAFGPAAHRLKYEAGVVSANAGMIKAPLDIMADKFRGYIGMAEDTIIRPETVLRACEALIPHIIANALAGADPDKNVPITIWAHRGCVPFISMETFNKIFWPTLKPVFEERLRELQDPAGEMSRIEPLINDICFRLEEFPLDIQTGKDAKAAETVSIFSGVAEKVFRIYNVLKIEGFPITEITVENIPVTSYITEFNTALKELLAAYEQFDTVLVGDLAEYEMSPRLRNLHGALHNALRSTVLNSIKGGSNEPW